MQWSSLPQMSCSLISNCMINTYNETHLHRTLKNLYSDENGIQEIAVEGFICDIYDGKRIIEIQTANLSALKNKLEKLLPRYPIQVIYPIIENAYITTLNADGSKRSYRKSPKHGVFYQIFRELSGLIQCLDSPNLSIQVLYIDCEIIKIDDKQGRSRYKRPHIIDKKLLKIHRQETLHGIDDFTASFMKKLPTLFISADLRKLCGTGVYTSYIVSFLKKCKKITFCTKAGRYHVYKKTDAEASVFHQPL